MDQICALYLSGRMFSAGASRYIEVVDAAAKSDGHHDGGARRGATAHPILIESFRVAARNCATPIGTLGAEREGARFGRIVTAFRRKLVECWSCPPA